MALNQDKKSEEKTSEEKNNSNSQAEFWKAQTTLLQEQLKQKNDAEENQKLEAQAEKLRTQQEALEEEADLRRTLGQAFPVGPSGNQEEENQSLDQQQMVTIMGEAVGKAIDANTKLLESKFSQVIATRDEQIDITQNALIKLMANMSVKEAKEANPDFDTYTEDVSSILGATQGLSPEDAYILAKGRKASLTPDANKLSSERPHESVQRSRAAEDFSSTPRREPEDKNQFISPRQKFSDACGKAIDKILAGRTG